MAQHRILELASHALKHVEGAVATADGHLYRLRREGHDALQRQGIPTPRHEEWKYTNVFPFIGSDFTLAVNRWSREAVATPPCASRDEIAQAIGDHYRIAIVNGVVCDVPSDLQADFEILELTPELVDSDEAVRQHLGTSAPMHGHPFVALNTALLESGIVIRLRRNCTLSRPLHISILTDTSESPIMVAPRILVIAEEGAEADIVQSHHVMGSHLALDVSVCECHVAPAAHVRYHKLVDDADQLRSIATTTAEVHRDGTFTSHAVSIGGKFVRNDLIVRLCEPSSQGFLYGVSLLADHEFTDNHTVVDHMVPHCHSEELYKGIYDGASTGVFNGKIYVRPQAQKTTAYQSNHTLLLSSKAQVQAKPQLEIWADDVKCSHGATMGQVDEEAIFYFRARGIDKDTAKALLTYAFITEVVEKITLDGLRDLLTTRIARKLSAEALLF